jgi:hypothetical protein
MRKKARIAAPITTTRAPIVPPTIAPVFDFPFVSEDAAEDVDCGAELVRDPLPAVAEALLSGELVVVETVAVGNDVAAPKILGFCIVIAGLNETPVYTNCSCRSVACPAKLVSAVMSPVEAPQPNCV